jgi:hypothetical protein
MESTNLSALSILLNFNILSIKVCALFTEGLPLVPGFSLAIFLSSPKILSKCYNVLSKKVSGKFRQSSEKFRKIPQSLPNLPESS